MWRSQSAHDLLQQVLVRLPPSSSDGAPVAVFDADGTLWGADASEGLLAWIDERGLIDPPAGSPSLLAHSDRLCEQSRLLGYTWAAQAVAGQRPEIVAGWAASSFAERILHRIHAPMAALVGSLIEREWDVYVVSASPIWAILPGTDRLGVPRSRVLAIEVELEDGLLTDRAFEPITSGPGKVARIERDIEQPPRFVAGNSIDDVPMLSMAELAMVVDPKPLHGDTTDLAAMAADRGWLVYRSSGAGS